MVKPDAAKHDVTPEWLEGHATVFSRSHPPAALPDRHIALRAGIEAA